MDSKWNPRILSVAGLVLVAIVAAPLVAGAQEPAKQGSPTFAKDVAPILQRSCQVCHRPGSIAPMSLLTYEDVRPWARAIKQRTSLREMPPWYVDRRVGIRKFMNDPSLSDAEIETIAKWADAGAPKGNPADMPPPKTFDPLDVWHIGKPDLVVTMAKDEIVPATGPDQWKNVEADPGLTEDRYFKAIETKPSKGHQVIHHAGSSMILPDDADPLPGGTQLAEYGIGKNGDIYPEGMGRLLKAGAKVNFNLHLHSIGEETPANVELAFVFYPKGYVPKTTVEFVAVGGTGDLDIPPNTDNVRVDGYMTLIKPARLLSFQPHMHNRGKAVCIEAIYPGNGRASITGGNKVETLNCVDRYSFAWHISYHYAEDAQPLLPAGTVLHVISWHNNTGTNKFNPDPEQMVTWGNRTVDDMSHTWMKWYYLTDEEYKQQVEARKAKKTSN